MKHAAATLGSGKTLLCIPTYILTLGSQINNTVGLFPLPCHLCAITYLLFAKFIDFFMPGVRLIGSAVSFIRA